MKASAPAQIRTFHLVAAKKMANSLNKVNTFSMSIAIACATSASFEDKTRPECVAARAWQSNYHKREKNCWGWRRDRRFGRARTHRKIAPRIERERERERERESGGGRVSVLTSSLTSGWRGGVAVGEMFILLLRASLPWPVLKLAALK
jgi:hypothetical protein